jgi:putative ABC transport system substrate-binding protein
MSGLSRRTFAARLARLGTTTAGLALLTGRSFVSFGPTRSRIPRVGLLSSEFPDPPWHVALWESSRDLGWVEGQNFAIERRYAQDQPDRFSNLAAELVRLPVDVIVTEGTSLALAAKQATAIIPIVTTSGDPLGAGLVASLARPGGNVSGVSLLSATSAKQLELLMGVVPGLSRLGVILNDNPASVLALGLTQAAAEPLGVQVQPRYVRSADELLSAFDQARQWSADGLIVRGDLFFLSQRAHIVDLAASSRLPALYSYTEFVEAGDSCATGPTSARVSGVSLRTSTKSSGVARRRTYRSSSPRPGRLPSTPGQARPSGSPSRPMWRRR